MKKVILSFLYLIMAGILSMKAQTAKIILQHGENVTFFKPHQLQEAIDAAVDGDIISLNEGSFTSNANYGETSFGHDYLININKNITLLGAGAENTIVNNTILIGYNSSVIIEGINILYLENENTVKRLHITKCIIKEMRLCVGKKGYSNGNTYYASYDIEDFILNQCYVSQFSEVFEWGEKHGKISGVVQNSYIKGLSIYYSSYSLPFTNCAIVNTSAENLILKNCIISFGEACTASSIERCLYYKGNNYDDQIKDRPKVNWFSAINPFDEEGNLVFTDEQIINAGYIGTDGTVIGVNGGIGYSLIPNRPTISDYNIKVDSQSRKMVVNLKVTSK